MASEATKWHETRRRAVLRQGHVKSLEKPSLTTLLSIGFVPVLHIGFCYLCKFLNFAEIALLAYTFGALCVMYIFSNTHEVFHGLISSKLSNATVKNIFFRLVTMTDITSGLYLYYKYGHMPHHANQAGHTVEDIEQNFLTKSMDLDPVTHFRNIYKFQFAAGEKPRYRFPIIERNRLARLVLVLVMPLVDATLEMIVEPFKLFFWWKHRGNARAKAFIRDIAIQNFFIYAFIGAMAYLFQDIHFLIYLFLSRVFFFGFLHPYALLWLSIHRSHESEQAFQPASSTYGRFVTFLSAGINLHVEHHDLPWISRSKLAKVTELHPDFYLSLDHFVGFTGVTKFLMQKEYDNTYSA